MADSPSKPSFSAGRRWAIGFNVILATVAVVALLGMGNYLAARYPLRPALTDYNRMQVTPQTRRVLETVTNNVKVVIFFDAEDEPDLYGLTTALLKEYSEINRRIVFQTIDPTRQPVQAEAVLSKYQLTGLKNKNFVLFDCDGRTKVIYQNELSDYDINAVVAGQSREFRRIGFKGEMLFTSAIFNLANAREYKVGFLTGHGEHDPDKVDDPHGYSKFAAILKERNNAQWEKVSLLGTNDIPADCHLVVIAGPRLPFESTELDKLNRFLKQGGRLFVLMANMEYCRGQQTGLGKLLALYGVGVANDMVSDLANSPTSSYLDLFASPVTAAVSSNPIMKALVADSDNESMRVRLVLPRMLGRPSTDDASNPDAPKVTFLAATSANGVAASEIRDGVPYHNPYSDPQGVMPLIAAVEQGPVKGVTTERGAMRMVVVGDSLCLDNELIDSTPANHYFAGLSVDWLLARPQVLLEGLLPQKLKDYRLVLSGAQLRNLQWIFLAGMPGAVLVLGGLVWLRRRK